MSNNEKLAKIAVNKSLLKEYSNSSNERIVYMNDNTEFQIQIFNPYSYIIGVSFEFNGNFESSQLLVLRPGERVWLDRYLDNESRLLFSTYEVGASEEVKKAIKDNGNLQIKFYKEKRKNYWNNYIFANQSTIIPKTIDVYYNNEFGNSICNNNLINFDSSINCVNTNFNCSPITSACIDGASYNTALSSNADKSLSIDSNLKAGTNSRIKSSVETGRIERGSHSNQKFENTYKDFESWPFKIEHVKILPSSQKQINTNDLTKRYCHNCGRKLNSKYKFCPFCGTKQ